MICSTCSRISRGKILLQQQRLDLVPLVRAAAEDQRIELTANGLTLTVEIPEEPLWLVGDPTRLAQVIGNLLDNAGKFTDPGGQVTVTLCADPAAATAIISIRDTGIGMEPELLQHIFESFTQADRTLARSRGGMGLGLALVRGLVQLHGGEVHATSAGQGQGVGVSDSPADGARRVRARRGGAPATGITPLAPRARDRR